MKNKIINSFSLILTFILFSSCSTNPSSGKKELIIMSESEEDSIGKSEHPKIIKQFGGIYNNEKLQNYIESLGNFLVSTSELPNKEFKFTVLNTPIINAFALPGGYIYLTRGLIYLCQNEAQLAGVIAHEIGHITARHTAKRYTQTVGTSLLANILGVLAKNNAVGNLINQSASLYLLSFSRSQEYEADLLATRYMIRAGFDPKEMANFLKKMEEYSLLQRKILKSTKNNAELLQTHPNSSKRVREVVSEIEEKIPLNPIIGKEVFLKKIDGMLFGYKPSNGFFYKNRFIHKPIGITFTFDKKFFFVNNPKFLLGLTNSDTKIFFDIDSKSELDDLSYFSKWSKKSKNQIQNFSSYRHNSFNISTAIISKKSKKIKLATIRNQKTIFRFAMISNDSEFSSFEDSMDKTIKSFRKIDEDFEISNFNPPKVRVLSQSVKEKSLKDIWQKNSLQPKFSKEFFEVFNDIKKENDSYSEKIKMFY